MGRLALVLLGTLVVVEVLLVIGIAAALFLLGATQTIVVATGMLLVAAIAVVVTLVTVRPRR